MIKVLISCRSKQPSSWIFIDTANVKCKKFDSMKKRKRLLYQKESENMTFDPADHL